MKKFLLIAPKNRTVYNFRGDLIKAIRERGYQVYVIGPNRDDIDRVLELGVEFVEVPMNKQGMNPVADLGYIAALRREIRRIAPDVTLSYTIKPAIYGAIAARLAGVKCINSMITGVGYLFTSRSAKARLVRSIAKNLYRVGLWCADNVIFQNPDDRAEFIANRLVSERKTHQVNGSGVNMAHFAAAPLPEEFRVLTISRALKSKGAEDYLRAAEMVHEADPSVTMTFLGAIDPSLPDSIDPQLIDSYVARGVVKYLPERADVRTAIADCSIFVLPSYREGTPRTVLEAMSMARPVITTDAPGCRQTVSPGVNGYLVPVADPRSLADAILRMSRMARQQLQVMADASRTLCADRFDVNLVNAEMLGIMRI